MTLEPIDAGRDYMMKVASGECQDSQEVIMSKLARIIELQGVEIRADAELQRIFANVLTKIDMPECSNFYTDAVRFRKNWEEKRDQIPQGFLNSLEQLQTDREKKEAEKPESALEGFRRHNGSRADNA